MRFASLIAVEDALRERDVMEEELKGTKREAERVREELRRCKHQGVMERLKFKGMVEGLREDIRERVEKEWMGGEDLDAQEWKEDVWYDAKEE